MTTNTTFSVVKLNYYLRDTILKLVVIFFFLQQTANCNELHIGKADFELDICGFLLDILMNLSFAGKLSLSSRNNLDYQTISVSSFPPRLE